MDTKTVIYVIMESVWEEDNDGNMWSHDEIAAIYDNGLAAKAKKAVLDTTRDNVWIEEMTMHSEHDDRYSQEPCI